MAFDFPATPSVGQVFGNYIWDGEKWKLQGGQALGAVRYDTAQILSAGQQAQARDNIRIAKKNYIINGAMMVSQENGATITTTNVYYPVDNFYIQFNHGGSLSTGQWASPTPGGSTHRIRSGPGIADAAVAAGDFVFLQHNIEGLRVADLMFGTATAKTVTLQFGVKAPAGTYCVQFYNGAGLNRFYIAEYVIAAGEANTDVVKSVTLTGDVTGTWAKDNTIGLTIRWILMAGSSFHGAANTWSGSSALATSNQFNIMGVVGNAFEIFDVSLTEGTVAPPFQVPDYASELALCQRYWGKSYRYDQAPGTIATDNQIAYVTNSSHGEWAPTVSYAVEMRGLPTYIIYSPQTGASSKRRNLSTGADETMTGFNIPGTKSHSGSTAGHAAGVQVYAYHFTRNARL